MDDKQKYSLFEQSLIDAVSSGLPLVSRPYQAIAQQLGCSESEVIAGINDLKLRGDIKRFGVVVRHRELGYRANGMVVWDIPENQIREVGQKIGQFDFVTLCYQRPKRLPDWPYNLFSMVHGRSRDEVSEQVQQLAERCELQAVPHKILFSNRCFKQRGARYAQPTQSKPAHESNKVYANG